tara:strand:- start:403 stop:594 length:192 start_codon:yes stop_codon:yes gene_type:complete
MESDAQRLLRKIKHSQKAYQNGEHTWEAWFAERKLIMTEAKILGVTKELLELVRKEAIADGTI